MHRNQCPLIKLGTCSFILQKIQYNTIFVFKLLLPGIGFVTVVTVNIVWCCTTMDETWEPPPVASQDDGGDGRESDPPVLSPDDANEICLDDHMNASPSEISPFQQAFEKEAYGIVRDPFTGKIVGGPVIGHTSKSLSREQWDKRVYALGHFNTGDAAKWFLTIRTKIDKAIFAYHRRITN
jgi:hypothetical protein